MPSLPDRPLRLAVLGTSNSILRDGWAAELAALRHGDVVENLSLGANTAFYGNVVLDGVDPDDYDFVFIDFTVNEQNFLDNGATTLENVRDAFAGVLARFRACRRCTPVAVLFFNRRHLDDPAGFTVRDLHLGLCAQYGVPAVDLRAWVRAGLDTLGADAPAPFRDQIHLSRTMARAVAWAISGTLGLARRLWQARRAPGVPGVDYAMLSEGEVDWGGCPEREERTALAAWRVRRLSAGLAVRLQTAGLLCGALFWKGTDTGWLCVDNGREVVRKNLNLLWKSGFYFREFVRPLEPGPEGFRLTTAHDGPCRDEVTMHATRLDGPEIERAVDLAGFLIRRPDSASGLPSPEALAALATEAPLLDMVGADYAGLLAARARAADDAVEPGPLAALMMRDLADDVLERGDIPGAETLLARAHELDPTNPVLRGLARNSRAPGVP